MIHDKNHEPCKDPNCWCKKFDKKWAVEEDVVNHPKHYEVKVKDVSFEVLDLIQEILTKEEFIGYLRGNCIKYHLRANKKNGAEDIQKAAFYNDILKDLVK